MLAKEAAPIFSNAIILLNIALLLIGVLNVAEGMWFNFFLISMHLALLQAVGMHRAFVLTKTHR